MSKKITLLIDGNNTLHRTHWVANNTGRQLINSKGINVGSTFTFLKTIKSYVDQFNADDVYIAWDKKLTEGAVNFRNTLTEGTYKAGRNQERNKAVYDGADEVVNITKTLGVKNIFPGELEADDVISWLSKNIEGKKVIISVDNDFAQLVSENISLYSPIKKLLIDVSNFEEHYGLTPEEFLYYKCIVGDKSDNISGIEGVGKIRGQKLAKQYVAKEANARNVCNAQVTTNLPLVDLTYGVATHPDEIKLYEEQLFNTKALKADFPAFIEYCTELEFNSILDKLSNWQSSFNKTSNNDVLAGYFKAFE
jgi:DNA polymerase I